jgi:hypothetical protein
MLYIELEDGDRIFVISTIELVRNNQEKYLRKYLPEYPGETASLFSPSNLPPGKISSPFHQPFAAGPLCSQFDSDSTWFCFLNIKGRGHCSQSHSPVATDSFGTQREINSCSENKKTA